MATPLVAGCVAVLREVLSNENPGASLTKVLLVHSADIISRDILRYVPCHQSGFRRVNLANSVLIGRRESERESIWGVGSRS